MVRFTQSQISLCLPLVNFHQLAANYWEYTCRVVLYSTVSSSSTPKQFNLSINKFVYSYFVCIFYFHTLFHSIYAEHIPAFVTILLYFNQFNPFLCSIVIPMLVIQAFKDTCSLCSLSHTILMQVLKQEYIFILIWLGIVTQRLISTLKNDTIFKNCNLSWK